MLAPAIPANEVSRLQTLRSLNILDTGPEDRFDRITRIAKVLFRVPIALITLIDEDRQWFKSRNGIDASETPRAISFCGHAILQNGTLLVENAVEDPRFCNNPLVTGGPGIRFYAGRPLVADGCNLGTLCVIDCAPRAFSTDDFAHLEDLAKMAEQELASAYLATSDDLTSLPNRRGFSAIGQHALNVCQRDSKSAAILFFDLDRFKEINDRFGHAEGDQALIAFGCLLRKVFRISDVVGRLGGDEFLVLLANPGETGASEALDRLDQAIHQFNTLPGSKYALSYSVGATRFDAKECPPIEQLIDEADRQMYIQKNQRRLASSEKEMTPSRRLWRVLTTPI